MSVYTFVPQEDITVYEVALLVATLPLFLNSGSDWGDIPEKSLDESLEHHGLPCDMRRHFVKESGQSEQ